jgi:ubiquitin C-terminal hydrolase
VGRNGAPSISASKAKAIDARMRWSCQTRSEAAVAQEQMACDRALTHVPTAEQKMKILAHSESHIVKLSDGSVWQIYPGDIDLTLNWLPTTELQLFEINDHVASHGLINCDDGSVVRVRPPGERWPEERIKALLKHG